MVWRVVWTPRRAETDHMSQVIYQPMKNVEVFPPGGRIIIHLKCAVSGYLLSHKTMRGYFMSFLSEILIDRPMLNMNTTAVALLQDTE